MNDLPYYHLYYTFDDKNGILHSTMNDYYRIIVKTYPDISIPDFYAWPTYGELFLEFCSLCGIVIVKENGCFSIYQGNKYKLPLYISDDIKVIAEYIMNNVKLKKIRPL